MSKKEIIIALIGAGNSFEEVVKLSQAKASYVKSQYTQLGLDWKAASTGEKDEVLKEDRPEELKEDSPEELKEDGPEGEVEEREPVQEEEEVAEDFSELYLSCLGNLDAANKARCPGLLKQRSARYREKVELIFRSECFKPQNLAALNSRFMCIKPLPNRMNTHRHVFKLHQSMRLLFKEQIKK